MSVCSADPMEALAIKFIKEVSTVSPADEQRALQVLMARLAGSTTAEQCVQQCLAAIGTADPAQKVNAIIETPTEPIASRQRPDLVNPKSSRSKARNWTVYEDQRLFAGVRKFGLNNWPLVAQFVGNWRTRSQCSQRWFRGLNPSLCKGPWTEQEETKLLQLVNEFGEKSWKRIASVFGNRSDVQCRYHFQQMQKHKETETQTPAKPISPRLDDVPDVQVKDIFQSPVAQTIDVVGDLDEMFGMKAQDRLWGAECYDSAPAAGGFAFGFEKW